MDDTIVFRPLGKDDLIHIVDLQLIRVEQLLADRGLKIDVSDDAKEYLVNMGYDPGLRRPTAEACYPTGNPESHRDDGVGGRVQRR